MGCEVARSRGKAWVLVRRPAEGRCTSGLHGVPNAFRPALAMPVGRPTLRQAGMLAGPALERERIHV
eukprot:scaffold7531_cov3496-Prasinococcus_capsulatus_cf.AAC.1